MNLDEQQKVEENQHREDLRELMGFIEELPIHRQDRARDLFRRLLKYDLSQKKTSVITMIWDHENTRRIKQKQLACENVLLGIIGACHGHPEIRTKVLPHVLTWKRFLQEQEGPEFTYEDARKQFEKEMIPAMEKVRAVKAFG
jgi:hypothetical protein